jgi:hypothetical protein
MIGYVMFVKRGGWRPVCSNGSDWANAVGGAGVRITDRMQDKNKKTGPFDFSTRDLGSPRVEMPVVAAQALFGRVGQTYGDSTIVMAL